VSIVQKDRTVFGGNDMGANEFGEYSFGKTAEEAFRKAVDQALHMHGHGGYTGTIAEKTAFELVSLPRGLTYARAMKLIGEFGDRIYAIENLEWNGEDPKAKRKAKAARVWLEKLDPFIRSFLKRCYKLTDDKWGPALALKVSGKDAKEYRERHQLKGKRGDVYFFSGLASC
jgi:hypothetical protein